MITLHHTGWSLRARVSTSHATTCIRKVTQVQGDPVKYPGWSQKTECGNLYSRPERNSLCSQGRPPQWLNRKIKNQAENTRSEEHPKPSLTLTILPSALLPPTLSPQIFGETSCPAPCCLWVGVSGSHLTCPSSAGGTAVSSAQCGHSSPL